MMSISRKPGMPRLGRRNGFSLIIVLIIALIGFAFVGATLQITALSAGGGRVSSAGNTRYNILQNAVEEGKAALKRAMDNDLPPLTYAGSHPSHLSTPAATPPPIFSSFDELLVDYSFNSSLGRGVVLTSNLGRRELGRYGIRGSSGVLDVRIFDMQYNPISVGGLNANQQRWLPPSLILSQISASAGTNPSAINPEEAPSGLFASSNAGVYLIRATLTVEGRQEPSVLDTAVIQSNNTVAP